MNRNKLDIPRNINTPAPPLTPSLSPSHESLETSPSLQQINPTKSEELEYPVSPQKTSKLIERLIEELDKKSEAIQKLGQDCLVLRKHAADKEKELKDLREKLKESDLKTKRLINSFDLDIIPAEEIRRRYALLADKLESALEKLSIANDKLRILDDAMVEKERTDMENKALRQAHTAQQTLVLDLQDSLQKAQKFKSVIMKQEEVIRQLEANLMKGSFASFEGGIVSSTKSHPSADIETSYISLRDGGKKVQEPLHASGNFPSTTSIAESVDLNSKLKDLKLAQNIPLPPSMGELQMNTGNSREIANLEEQVKRLSVEKESFREKIAILSKENFILHDRISSLEEQLSKLDELHKKENIKGEMPMEMFKLLMRAEAAEIKVKALEEQLIESARVFGRQIKELKNH